MGRGHSHSLFLAAVARRRSAKALGRRGCDELANELRGAYGTVMKLPVVMRPGEDGWIVVECPLIPGYIDVNVAA